MALAWPEVTRVTGRSGWGGRTDLGQGDAEDGAVTAPLANLAAPDPEFDRGDVYASAFGSDAEGDEIVGDGLFVGRGLPRGSFGCHGFSLLPLLAWPGLG